MNFTLPADVLPELKLPRGYCLDWTQITPSGSAVECNLYFPEDDAGYCLGMASADGNTVADAFLALFADPIFEDAVLPADVAAALDELAHQAVRVVCQRLSGGTLDEATLADAPEGYVGNLCADDYDPALVDPFAIDANPVHCPVCGSEMIMDYDGGELGCSADECDARQPVFDEPAPEPGSAEEAFHWGKLQELFPVPFEGNHPRSKEFVLR